MLAAVKRFFASDESARRRGPAPRATLGLTALEGREVPAGLTAVLNQGVLTVTGTSGNDTIRVVQTRDTANYGKIQVDGATIRVNGQNLASVPDNIVSRVVELGGAGNDSLGFQRAYSGAGYTVNAGIQVTLDGGAGINTYDRLTGQDTVIDPVLTQGKAMTYAVLDKWNGLGGAAGRLGSPTADMAQLANGVTISRFQKGDIYTSPTTGLVAVIGPIKAKYDALGGPAGSLGLPTRNEESAAGLGCYFQNGLIVWSQATGAHVIPAGSVFDKYIASGGGNGPLGLPTRDMESGRGYDWCYFQKGVIVASPATGAHAVPAGPVYDKYMQLGGGYGFLGAPTTDVTSDRGMTWCYFQGGVIVSSAAGTFEVHGAILEKYVGFGGGFGWLGAPTSDEVACPGGRVSHFQNGDIYWSAATGAHIVFGAIRDKYNALGGPGGGLGLPTGDLTFVGSGIMTHFQNGDIYYSTATGAHVVYGAILQRFNALGGVGFCGFPTTDEVAVRNGRASFFQYADIYWSVPTGAHELTGRVRDYYNQAGGANSFYGLPTGVTSTHREGNGRFTTLFADYGFQYGWISIDI